MSVNIGVGGVLCLDVGIRRRIRCSTRRDIINITSITIISIGVLVFVVFVVLLVVPILNYRIISITDPIIRLHISMRIRIRHSPTHRPSIRGRFRFRSRTRTGIRQSYS